ncbi:hypothetical protein [Phascolarctobacterium succinatutens]|uniref:hypothetical protein n=1 Tax=Phascolarctobacterium succinatutens TaxID=626940 RepID=UPI003078EE01
MNRQLADNEDRRKNLHDFKKKICGTKKNFTDFERFFEKKQLKSALFLRFFQEILKAIKAIVKHVSFSTNPSVSLKNLKKVSKKVLT